MSTLEEDRGWKRVGPKEEGGETDKEALMQIKGESNWVIEELRYSNCCHRAVKEDTFKIQSFFVFASISYIGL